jgi:PIN domain nuclease of toxin-antitoxin system
VRVILDTHALLWAAVDAPALSARARGVIRDPDSVLFLSAASVYELTWKVARGRLALPSDPASWVRSRMDAFRLRPMPIEVPHAIEAASLPPIHGDPWVRLLVAQARLAEIPLLTSDERIRAYDVEAIW